MRTVSLMGSTGSVGTQALDVIRREPERYRVHALAAQRSAASLVAQAVEFGPDLVVIGAPDLYDQVREGVPARTEVAVGEEGMVEAARGADVVLNAVVGFAGLPVTMATLEAGKRLALGQQGVAHRRGARRAEGPPHPGGGDRPGGLRALRAAPVPRLRAGHDRRGPAAADRLGGTLPGLDGRADAHGHRGGRPDPSDVVDGTEDHHRLVDADEQGPRGDRGPRALRGRLRPHRHRGAPAVDRPFHGGVARRVDAGTAVRTGHAPPHRLRPGLAGPRARRRSVRSTGRGRRASPSNRPIARSSGASTWPTRRVERAAPPRRG